MLKEKNIFRDELPVNVITAYIEEYPIHFHDEPEVVFVLKGSVKLRVGYYDYLLEQGDVFIINDKETHSFAHTNEDNMVMMLQLDLAYFSKYYDNFRNTFFVTDIENKNDESLGVLRSLLIRIMSEILGKGAGYRQNVIENTHNLIECLMSDFQYFAVEGDKFVNEPRKRGNKVLASRLNRITNYMYENYTTKLTLNEIAEIEHLSIYYLSHVIKEATGLSFKDLLSFIRVEQSEMLLLGTNAKMGAIAKATGFSAVRYYIKHFEKWFGMHPQQYRKKFAGKVSTRETPAVYDLSAPSEIEKILKTHVKGSTGTFSVKKDTNSTVIALDIPEEYKFAGRKEKKEVLLQSLLSMGTSNIAPAIEPYNTLRRLGETVIKDEKNYTITTPSKWPEKLENLSILVFNFNDVLKNKIGESTSLKETSELVEQYDEENEILIKCAGLSGDFNIVRYKLSRENIIAAYKEILRSGISSNSRMRTIGKWSAMPSVEFSRLASSGTLSIRVDLKGFSTELIMIDKE